jgi:hypothetical protein
MRTFLFVTSATLFLFAAGLVAQAPKPVAAPAPRPRPAAAASSAKAVATVKDVMDFIVIPSSEFVFNSVSSTEGPNGPVEKQPRTEEEWTEVKKHALLLSEAGNLLMVPGRHVASPKDKSNNPGSELEPAQMDALVAKSPAAFAAKARGLIDATALALKAIDAKNVEGLSDAGGAIDEACENCHLTYWYPNEKKK